MESISNTDLQRFGLSDKEAITYSTLLEDGESSVAEISKKTNTKKGSAYNILTALISRGIVEQSQIKPKALYRVTDPAKFRDLIREQQVQVQENASLLETLLPHLVSTYNTTTNAPSVRIYEGLEGVKTVYGEILRSKTKEQLTIVSSKGSMQDDEETRAYIRTMRLERARLHIKNRIIGRELPNTKKHILNDNPELLVERRLVDPQFLNNPAEILIWNNCIALAATRNPQIITVIENESIAETFRNIFEYMWARSQDEHSAIIQSWS